MKIEISRIECANNGIEVKDGTNPIDPNDLDFRTDLEYIKGYTSHVFSLFFIKTDGLYFNLVRKNESRGGFDAICMYINKGIKNSVPVYELEETINFIKSHFDDWDTIKQEGIFSKNYEGSPEEKSTNNRPGNKWAYREVGFHYTLAELLEKPYQSYYTGYKSIFLLDENQKDLIDVTRIDNLTEEKLYDSYPFKPEDDWTLYKGDEALTNEIPFTSDETLVNLVWKRTSGDKKDRYQPIRKTFTPKTPNDISIKEKDIQIEIFASDVSVIDEKRNDLTEAKVTLNGKTSCIVTEETHVDIDITYEGYERKTKIEKDDPRAIEILYGSNGVKITRVLKKIAQEYKVIFDDYSSIKGAKYTETDQNKLKFLFYKRKIQGKEIHLKANIIPISIITLIALVGIICSIVFTVKYFTLTSENTNSPTEETTEMGTEQQDETSDLVKYLEERTEYTKKDLEELKPGLFETLITFDKDKIKRYNPTPFYDSSEKFQKIYNLIINRSYILKDTLNKRKQMYADTIQVSDYIDFLSKHQERSSETSASQNSHSSGAKSTKSGTTDPNALPS